MAEKVDEQLEALQTFAETRHQQRTRLGCLGVITFAFIGLVLAAYHVGGWAFIPFALFLVILGLGINHSSVQIAPRLRDARQALDHHEAVRGLVRIVVNKGSDSDDYQAGVRDRQGEDWTFDFNPSGWIPTTGDHAAELRFIEGVEWPVLIVMEAGILYPKSTPTQARLDFPEASKEEQTRPLPFYLASAICLLLGGLILAGAWGAYLRDSGIVREGVGVDAVVVRAGFLVAEPGERHGLVYRFILPDGRVIERTWTEDDPRWKAFRVGDYLRVHYDPANPSRNFPVGEGVTSLGVTLFVSAFGVVFLFFASLLLVGGYRVHRRP